MRIYVPHFSHLLSAQRLVAREATVREAITASEGVHMMLVYAVPLCRPLGNTNRLLHSLAASVMQ